MNKKLIVLLIILITLTLYTSTLYAEGSVKINVQNAGSTSDSWQSTGKTIAQGVNWGINIETIINHGVGRVWNAKNWRYGSGLYTFSTKKNAVHKYNGVVHGNSIVWRMRADNDYTTAFSCTGWFIP